MTPNTKFNLIAGAMHVTLVAMLCFASYNAGRIRTEKAIGELVVRADKRVADAVSDLGEAVRISSEAIELAKRLSRIRGVMTNQWGMTLEVDLPIYLGGGTNSAAKGHQ